jgi:hypothetical protein
MTRRSSVWRRASLGAALIAIVAVVLIVTRGHGALPLLLLIHRGGDSMFVTLD